MALAASSVQTTAPIGIPPASGLASVEMNRKISRQNSSPKEKERKKRHETTEETNLQREIIEVPLEQSIWAPENRSCESETLTSARIPSYNVPGGTKEERINMVKWVLNMNKHITSVEEVFARGNN